MNKEFRMDRMIKSVLSFLLFSIASSAGASETQWQDHEGIISTRIIVGSNDLIAAFPAQLGNQSVTGHALMAWEAKLAGGWKTYWRSPGEAGLPVRVHAGDSELELYYPVPQRFELFGLETYGYSKNVVIPFLISEADVSGNVKLNADFMVCKDICIPFKAEYNVNMASRAYGSIVADTKITSWFKNVPVRNGSEPSGLKVTSVEVSGLAGHQKLLVEATSDFPMSKADVLAETGGMIEFHSPDRQLLKDGRSIRFVLAAMSSRKDVDISGEDVRLTVIDGRGNAIEQHIQLPAR
jgi:suppressor for copper-sensitivity B